LKAKELDEASQKVEEKNKELENKALSMVGLFKRE
jgi:hypothetical protein